MAWACYASAWAAPARRFVCKLVTDEVLHPIRLNPVPQYTRRARGQLVGYMFVASSDIGAGKTLQACFRASLRPKEGRGPSLAARVPPIAVRTRCACASSRRCVPALQRVVRRASASLCVLAAADALAGAGRALRTSSRTGASRTSGTSITGTRTLRVFAAATATRAAVGAAALAGVQRAITVLGAATRSARTRRVRGRSRSTT